MILSIILLIIGFLLLVKGADFFVEGASDIARKLGIPSIVIGLTIVALGTSLPELAVSVTAALKGSNDIALGNVTGSNIMNLLVVVGLAAVIRPVAVKRSVLRRDYVMMFLMILLMLGILGEYLWRTLDAARTRPPFIIDRETAPREITHKKSQAEISRTELPQ